MSIWNKAVISVFASILFYSTQVFAQIPSLTISDAFEKIDPIVPISGDGIAGVVMVSAVDKITPDALYIRIVHPSEQIRSFSVHLGSSDNRYNATWKVEIPSGFSGWAHMPYPGKARKRLKAYKINELAALAIDENNTVYPVRWGQPADGDKLFVMINSERARSYAVARENGKPKKLKCNNITSLQTLRFDKFCEINLKTVVRNGQGIKIRRNQSGLILAPIIVKIDD